MNKERKYDFIIVGGGIVGLTIANELINTNPKSKIAIIEKEKEIGLHSFIEYRPVHPRRNRPGLK